MLGEAVLPKKQERQPVMTVSTTNQQRSLLPAANTGLQRDVRFIDQGRTKIIIYLLDAYVECAIPF